MRRECYAQRSSSMRGPCKAGLIALLLPLLSLQAIACSLENPAEYLESTAALAQRFWFASIVLGGLILCLDACEKMVSLALPIAGWLLSSWGLLCVRSSRCPRTSGAAGGGPRPATPARAGSST